MRIMRFFVCVIALLAVPCGLFAQAGATGSILGTVTDSTGAIIPGAKVTVTNTATGVAFHTTTSSAGDFQAPALRPGVYTVAAEATGFSKSLTSPFTLTVDQTVRLTVALKAGAVTETVQVSAQGISLDTADASLSQLVSQQQVAELPLDGRNFVQLLFLSAGAVTIGGEQGTMRQGEGNAISINGGRPEGNNFTLDGVTNNDTAMETPVVILSQDAIQEFKVESGVYPAEYGFSVGQVNIVSKGGTNSLHGALFESNRSYQFDASPFATAGNYISGVTIHNPVLELNQFGFVAGGPVEIPKLYHGRNKSFWMANYEGWRMNNGQVLSASFPYTDLISGNFNNETYPALPTQTVNGNSVALPGGQVPAYGTPQCTALLVLGYNCMPVDPTTGNPYPNNTMPAGDFVARVGKMAVANGYFPTPTILGQTEGNTDFIQNVPGPLHQNQQTYRGDQTLGKLGSLMGRYTKTSYINSTLYNSSSPTHGFEQYYEDGLSWEIAHTISIGQKSVNNFRLGYLSANAPQGSQAPTAAALATLGELNDFTTYSALQQSWPGLGMTNYSNGGGPGNSYTGSYSPQWDISDSFTSVHGKHTFGFGFEYRYWTITRNLDDDFYGDWSFSSNTITGNSLLIPAGDPGAGTSSCPNAPVVVGTAAPASLCGTGNAVADMMLGYYNGVSGFVPGPLSPTNTAGNPQTHVYHYVGPYFEDNWKVTSKLSVNYGLRYDFRAATYELHNHFFWLDTTNTQGGLCYADPTLSTDGVAPGVGYNGGPILRYCGSVPRPAPKNPFAPRLGIDYRLDDKTVLRAGFGIFYAGYEGREIDDSADIYPYSIRLALSPTSVANPAADPKSSNQIWPAYGALTPFPVSTLSFIAVIESENPLNPYVETWTMGVQRELAKNTTLDINYIGNRGIHLLDRHDIAQQNDIPAADLPFCQEQDSNGNYFNAVGPTATAPCSISSRLPYPNFNGTYIDSDFHGYSMYNAGNVKLEHRAADLALTVVYTWAKSMDDKSATAGAGASLTGYEGFMDNHNEHLDYGRSDFDVPQRFVASYVYQLPFGRGKHFASNINRAADLAIGQWQLTGIATLQKGFPYSVSANDIDGITGTGGMRANLVPGCNLKQNNYSGVLAQFSRLNINCFTNPAFGTYGDTARNFLTQPGINNWDMSIGKGFALGEGARFVFKVDAFNTFNHHQYSQDVGGLIVAGSGGNQPISASVGSSQGGLIEGASAARILQFGGKITF